MTTSLGLKKRLERKGKCWEVTEQWREGRGHCADEKSSFEKKSLLNTQKIRGKCGEGHGTTELIESDGKKLAKEDPTWRKIDP